MGRLQIGLHLSVYPSVGTLTVAFLIDFHQKPPKGQWMSGCKRDGASECLQYIAQTI